MNLSGFDLNLLRVLDALLREGSTVKAGQRIGLSQPAVSAALSRLRHALKDPLFVRHGQSLQPTDYAKSLEAPLRNLLDQLASLLAGPAALDPSQSTDSFKLSGSDFFAEMLMPKLAATLAKRAPAMRVQMIDLVPENYVGTLERYEVDLALIPKAEFPDWIDFEPVFWSRFVAVARKDNPLLRKAKVKRGQVIPLDLFCTMGHVLFSPEGRTRSIGDAALTAIGRSRRVVMTLPVFSGVCSAVAQSDHLALLPRQLADAVSARLGLAVYEPPMTVPPAQICMIWHKRATASPPHRWLRGCITEILAPLTDATPKR